jgi:hypothetical protein
MLQALRLLTFLAFVALALGVARSRHTPSARRWSDLFIGYVLAFNLFVAVSQTDGWPFSPYRMMAVDSRERGVTRSMVAFRVVDAAGRECDVDPLAWSPLFPMAVMGWYEVRFPRASAAERQAAASFLLDRAEDARRRRAAGERVGNERLLGPLTAWDVNLSRAVHVAPQGPLVAFRVYRLRWVAERLLEDEGSVQRELLYEHRRP